MSKRKCAYTGKDSFCSDKPLPSEVAEQEIHNWTNNLPCAVEYKESKKNQLPNDLEAEIHETFYLLEITRWKVKYLEIKLAKLQEVNNTRPSIQKTGIAKKNREQDKEKKKNAEIEAANLIKETIDNDSKKIEEMLKKKPLF